MEQIQAILIQRGYSENAARIVARQLSEISPAFTSQLHNWLETATEENVECEGYSTAGLMQRFTGMTYPAALLTIDWLKREPQKAKTIIEKGIR